MDRIAKPLQRPQRAQNHPHHTTHHGRTPRRNRQRIPTPRRSLSTLRHRSRRRHPSIRTRKRRQLERRQLLQQQQHHQHRTRRRHERHTMHPRMHGRISTTLRRHRPTTRMDTPTTQRTQRQHLAPPRNPRHRPRRMPRPRTKRARRTIHHQQSKPNANRRQHDRRTRHLELPHRS